MAEVVRLYRLPETGVIAGVCSGMSEYFEVDVTLVRALFVLFAFATSGVGVLLYLVMAVSMPTRAEAIETTQKSSTTRDRVAQTVDDAKTSLQRGGTQARTIVGVGLVVLGGFLLLEEFGLSWLRIDWEYVWPLALIAVGLIILLKVKKEG